MAILCPSWGNDYDFFTITVKLKHKIAAINLFVQYHFGGIIRLNLADR